MRFAQPLADRSELAFIRSQIDLARAGDAFFRVRHELFPVRQPSGRSRNGEQHGEHLGLEAHRFVDDSGVEIDVRVKAPLDEVVVIERNLFELDRQVDLGVLAGDLEDFVGDALDDTGARIVVFVDAVTEAHQTSPPRPSPA